MAPAPPTIAGAIAAELAHHDVGHLFGLVGSTNFTVTRALVDGGLGFTAARHETNAVVMAQAWTQVTGRLGLATVHTGPGLTNALTGITEAAKSRTPLLVLVGNVARGAVDSNFAIEEDAVCRGLGILSHRVHTPRTALQDTARAADEAVRRRRTVVLHLPLDIQERAAAEAEPVTRAARPAPRPRQVDPADVMALADRLEAAERPVVLAGLGAVLADAGPTLTRVGELTGALLATTARAHGLFAGEAWTLGVSGGFSTPETAMMLARADAVLGFGASFTPWTTRFGRLFAAANHRIQIDDDPQRLGLSHEVTEVVLADARVTAEHLLTELERRGVRREGWRTDATRTRLHVLASVERGVGKGRAAARIGTPDVLPAPSDGTGTATASRLDGRPPTSVERDVARGTLDPHLLTRHLDVMLPTERTVAIDGGHFSGWPVRELGVPDAAGWVFVQAFQSIGLGLATGIGAATARPDRLTVVAAGDGGLMMSLPDLDTAVREQRWLLLVVYNDAAYGAEVHHFGPDGHATDIVEYPGTDIAAIARGFGAHAAVVHHLGDLEVVARWLEDDDRGVFVIDARVDRGIVADWLREALGSEHVDGPVEPTDPAIAVRGSGT